MLRKPNIDEEEVIIRHPSYRRMRKRVSYIVDSDEGRNFLIDGKWYFEEFIITVIKNPNVTANSFACESD